MHVATPTPLTKSIYCKIDKVFAFMEARLLQSSAESLDQVWLRAIARLLHMSCLASTQPQYCKIV